MTTWLDRTMGTTFSLTAIGLALTVALSACSSGQADVTNEAGTPVRVQLLREMTFTSETQVQGTLESVRFAIVPAKSSGTIERILAEEGDVVAKGQALCELDSENLRRAVEIQENELAVASNALAVANAQAAQARAGQALAERDHVRIGNLSEDQVVSAQQMDQAESMAVSAAAALDVAEANVELSRARVRQATTALAIARRNLNDATVRAPIDGVISMRHRERGEMVRFGDPVFRIDDPSALEASVFVPARYYGEIVPDTTVANVTVGDVDLGTRTVSYRSPTVDRRLRVFEVKARIDDPPPGVVAGALADVRIVLTERVGRGVPADAVLTRANTTVAFVVDEGTARRTAVRTGLRTDGYLEIVGGVERDATVIVQGQAYVSDGDAIEVVGD